LDDDRRLVNPDRTTNLRSPAILGLSQRGILDTGAQARGSFRQAVREVWCALEPSWSCLHSTQRSGRLARFFVYQVWSSGDGSRSPIRPAGNAFRIYVEASDTIQSGIAITNTSSSNATVRFELTNFSGVTISTTSMTLGPNAQVVEVPERVARVPGAEFPIQGLLRITSTSPIAVAGIRARSNERGDFLITTTPPFRKTRR
jgi:hypothetical protein